MLLYLDHNATTNLHPSVKSKMDEYAFMALNPSSIHSNGRKARSLLDSARASITKFLNCNDYHITFTSCGTEANNLILLNYKDDEIFISSIEHQSIFAYNKLYSNIKLINVGKNGILDLEDLENKLSKSITNKKLVSVMLGNNETGIIQPVKEIAKIAHKYGASVHSDCVQAIGKINVDILDLGVDFVTISGHKFGGPSGVGALISHKNFHLSPLLIGGGQERGARSGTENVSGIIGLGEASKVCSGELLSRIDHMIKLRDQMEIELTNNFSDLEIVGINTKRLANTSLIINPTKTAEVQLIALDMKGVAVSSGSACSSGKVSKSHVLTAMGYPEEKIQSAIRVSVGYTNTESDINNFLEIYKGINKGN